MKQIALLMVLLGLSGCGLLPSRGTPKTAFDLDPSLTNTILSSSLSGVDVRVYDVTAPAWIDHSSMYYRLAYRNSANPMPYARSEWVMSPAALLTQRLRSRLSDSTDGEIRQVGIRSAGLYALRSELAEFEQVFDEEDRSRGVIRLRVTLEGEGIWTQRTFVVSKPAPSADAAGGVHALTECSDDLAASIVEWLAAIRSNSSMLQSARSEP